jgi:hypothetical protein
VKKKPKIERDQYAALQKRLNAGKPLTAAQMAFVKSFNDDGSKETDAGDYDVVGSAYALARRLGVSRQLLIWHQHRDGAPKTFSVGAWRDYLLAHGKGATIGRVESGTTGRDTRQQVAEDAALAQFNAVSNALPEAIAGALQFEKISITDDVLDRVVFQVWLVCAAAQQSCAERQDLAGVFDSDADGVDYPRSIVELCSRISGKATDQNPQETAQ